MRPRPCQPLEQLEVRRINAIPTEEETAAAEKWLEDQRRVGAAVSAGDVFSAGGAEFAVCACTPAAGGRLRKETQFSFSSSLVPPLQRVQLTYLGNPSEDTEERLYTQHVRPLLEEVRAQRRQQGGHFLLVLSQEQVLQAGGLDFGVRALDPAGRYGALDHTTEVFTSQMETPALEKIHVLPYKDTLPDTYAYNLFRDYLQPFLQAHPFATYARGDHFTYQGVRFCVMATHPAQVVARVSNQTMVYTEGEALRPNLWDLMPSELREELQRLPRGLQVLLLNTMSNEEAVLQRLTEVRQVLQPGQGLQASEVDAAGRCMEWRSADRLGETQQTCMVCLTEFEEGEQVRQLGCDHLFHRQCIDEWLQRSAACPLCKRPVARGSAAAAAGQGVQGEGAAVGAELLRNAEVVLPGDRIGRVLEFDEQRQRFRIRLEGPLHGQECLAAADDVVQRRGGVKLMGLRQAEFNGREVQVAGWDAVQERYQVRLEGGRILAVKPERCLLPEGAVARVRGLRSAGASSRWNGHYGWIVSYDQRQRRHILAMPPRNHLLSVQAKNLRL